MKRKIVIGIVVFFLLVLLIPIPLQMKDGGSVQYRALFYNVTKYHQIALNTEESESGEVIESGHLVGWGIEILGIEIFNNVKYVRDEESIDLLTSE